MTTATKAILLSDVPDSSEVWHKLIISGKPEYADAFLKHTGLNTAFYLVATWHGKPHKRTLIDHRYLQPDLKVVAASQAEAEMCEAVGI